MQNDVPIGRMEFVDPKSIRVINDYSGKFDWLDHGSVTFVELSRCRDMSP